MMVLETRKRMGRSELEPDEAAEVGRGQTQVREE